MSQFGTPSKKSPLDISVGSAIAIVGVLFVGAGTTLTFFYMGFVFIDWTDLSTKSLGPWATTMLIYMIIAFVWLMALPLTTAFKLTKSILGKED